MVTLSSVYDPGKDARKQARKQEALLKRQQQKERLSAAEETDEAARIALGASKGRRSLIKTSMTGTNSLGGV